MSNKCKQAWCKWNKNGNKCIRGLVNIDINCGINANKEVYEWVFKEGHDDEEYTWRFK